MLINGKICNNAKWKPRHKDKGLPYISCDAQTTITGISNVQVVVANQTGDLIITQNIDDESGMRAVCLPSGKSEDQDNSTGQFLEYWGRHEPIGELCAPCQPGTKCYSGSYEAPRALNGFFIVDLDITANFSTPMPSEPENLIDRRKRRDYDRALETFRHNGMRVCPGERLLTKMLMHLY